MNNNDGDVLGRLVRDVWVKYCIEIGDTKPSHLAPWEELSEQDKEADRRIGAAVYALAARDLADMLVINGQLRI